MKWFVLVLVGCARAGSADIDSGVVHQDTQVKLDGSMLVDAPGTQTRTLAQTNVQTIKAATSLACGSSSGPGTAANNYYRVFDLAAYGITTDFHVTKVSFQVEACHSYISGNGAAVAVRVGTYSGTPGATLSSASMVVLASNATVMVPEVIESGTPPTTPGGTVDAPITATIPAGSKLFVEVDAPDGTNRYYFYMGANDGGETGFGYVLAPVCNITSPKNISSVNTSFPNVNLLLTVTGTI